jgi:hypothetical protein
MSRATDPQRMNWLWRLVCEVAELGPADVVEALHASQVAVDQTRARSWFVSDRDDSFFPITIAEVERNLRAVLLLREAMRENGELTAADQGEVAPDSDAFANVAGDPGVVDGALEVPADAVDESDESVAPAATDAA